MSKLLSALLKLNPIGCVTLMCRKFASIDAAVIDTVMLVSEDDPEREPEITSEGSGEYEDGIRVKTRHPGN